MKGFIARYESLVTSVLSGFDRLVFRGTLLPLVWKHGMFNFLQRAGVRLLDFKTYVQTTSERLKAAALQDVRKLDRPQVYLGSSRMCHYFTPAFAPVMLNVFLIVALLPFCRCSRRHKTWNVPRMQNAASYGGEDGRCFAGEEPSVARSVPASVDRLWVIIIANLLNTRGLFEMRRAKCKRKTTGRPTSFWAKLR